jgi:hypothetical protein
VPFAAVPPVHEEIGHRDPPVPEIVANDPVRAITDSARRLHELGWARRP